MGTSVCLAETIVEQLADPDGAKVIELSAGVFSKPLTIERALTLRGHADGTTLVITADEPAIRVAGNQPIGIENITIRWQLASSRAPRENRSAIIATDATLNLKNCRFKAAGNDARCPAALSAAGFSKVSVQNCQFEGFEFTVGCGGGGELSLTQCKIRNAGHCGASVFSSSTLNVTECIVAGGTYHGLRCTGGTLNATGNLIIDNKNRGIYLGNKPAHGQVKNNLFVRNAEGISGFAATDSMIENNVFIDNSFAALDFRDTCSLTVTRNLFVGNEAGVIQFGDSRGFSKLSVNGYWDNSKDVQDVTMADDSLKTNPIWSDAANGDFRATSPEVVAAKQGLTDPAALQALWKQYHKSNEQ